MADIQMEDASMEASIVSESMDMPAAAAGEAPSTSGIDPAAAPEDEPVASTSKAPAPAPVDERSHIKASDVVLLELPSENVRMVKLADISIVNLGRYGAFSKEELVGRPYGVPLEIVPHENAESDDDEDDEAEPDADAGQDAKGKSKESDKEQRKALKKQLKKQMKQEKKQDRKMLKETPRELSTLRLKPVVSQEIVDVTTATNELIQARGAKTLSQEEIMEMKRQGVSGQEIIERQIAEHEAFALKNEFSKQKYRKIKESKFLKFFTPLPPTVHNVCQYWFDIEPRRIRDLRPDSLSQMMSLANIRPNARVFVVDDTSGMLTAAVLERLGGSGLALVLHPNDSPPPNAILPLLNFPEHLVRKEVLRDLHWGYTDDIWQAADIPLEIEGDDGVENERKRARLRKRKAAQEHLTETVSEWQQGNFDAFVMASHFDAHSVLKRVLPKLAGSASLAIHSPTLQPLSALLPAMLENPLILNPTISEPWLRQYQVLLGRTHPEMAGIGHGGFLMSAIRVLEQAKRMTPARSNANKRRRR